MNPPSATSYLIGNPLSAAAIFLGTLYAAYQFWMFPELMPWPVPLVGLMASSKAWHANRYLLAYKAWKREWDTMGGVAPPVLRRGVHNIRAVIVGVCCAASYGYFEPQTSDEYAQACMLALSGMVVLFMLVEIIRKVKNRPKAQAKADPPVIASVCLPVPRSSALAARIPPALPDYCQALLRPRPALSAGTPAEPEPEPPVSRPPALRVISKRR
jgi:hypothetical protein